MNRKNNKHYRETDETLRKIFFEITEEQKTPTITEICRRAHINRSTFYLHYEDIVEMMRKIQAEIFRTFYESCKSYEGQLTLMSYDGYLLFARHIQEYKSFYRTFFSSNSSFPLQDGFEGLWENIVKPYYQECGIQDDEIMMTRFICYQAGLTLSLKYWVEQDCHISCSEMAKILMDCIHL